MPSIASARPTTRRRWPQWTWPLAVATAVLGVLGALLPWAPAEAPRETASSAQEAAVKHPPGPPWRHGRADARFTLIEYADLECPYCQDYAPILRQWIDQHPDVNLQWHHLPLPMHEPMATRQARLAECVGEAHGHAAFWQAIAWLYQHSRSDGQGLPPGTDYPGQDQAVQACLASERPDAVIQTQAEQARRAGVTATPTLRLIDRRSGQSLTLAGPAEGDTLLSALDLLAAGGADVDTHEPHPGMPADVVSDMPR